VLESGGDTVAGSTSATMADRAVSVASVLVAASIGLSAFLLFALELLVGRLVLPAFGGTPAAWATVLVFFQAVLLLGYLYGHLVVSRLSIRAGAAVHVVVVALALASLLAWPSRLDLLRDPALHPIADLLRVLAIAVGGPAFVLTTTTPLLSSWYARLRGVREGDDPFWLYAVSNGASLAALIAYPLLFERVSGLAVQRQAWELGFGILAAGLAGLAVLVAVRPGRRHAGPGGAGRRADFPVAAVTAAIPSRRRLAWVLIAAVPTALLSAVSNLVATDLVAAPLLWMGPLAIYLLSFVIAFSRRGRRLVPAALALTPAAVTLLWVPLGSVGMWPALPLLVVAFVGFAVVATGLNGVLALDRPGADHLTEFYLLLAVGGVLGGSFVGIVAPLVFPNIWEYPILLVATLVAVTWGAPAGRGEPAPDLGGLPPSTSPAVASASRPGRGLHLRPFVAGAPGRLLPYLAAAALVIIAIVPLGGTALDAVVRWLAVGALLLCVGGIPRFFVVATAVLLILVTLVLPEPALFQDRSFFGVTRVIAPGGGARIIMNGTTVHGLQATDPALRREPTAYYVGAGPAGDVFATMRGPADDRPLVVGVAGLGSGVLATYGRAGDAFTFYEIDPVVIRVASDPALFTFLSDARGGQAIVEGDARLTLGQVPDSTHDLLIVDAFSSDTPPVHLLTVEAIADAMRTLRPGGILALHLSNRYYDLAPAVAGAAEALGFAQLKRQYGPTPDERSRLFATPSQWVAIAREPADLVGLAARGWTPAGAMHPVTDDRPDILRLLRPLW
jgi:SAM-dependent methyltransferase